MNGRVIFFPLKHCPSEEKLKELKQLQERLYYYRIEFLNTVKRISDYQKFLAHNRYRSLLREKIFIVPKD